MPARSSAARYPSSRAWLHSSDGRPVMVPIRRWPISIRCSVAIRPPAQLVAPIDGIRGSGWPTGSTMTTGMCIAASLAR